MNNLAQTSNLFFLYFQEWPQIFCQRKCGPLHETGFPNSHPTLLMVKHIAQHHLADTKSQSQQDANTTLLTFPFKDTTLQQTLSHSLSKMPFQTPPFSTHRVTVPGRYKQYIINLPFLDTTLQQTLSHSLSKIQTPHC